MSLPRQGNLSVLTRHPHSTFATTVRNVLPKRKGLAALCGRNTEPASEGSAVGTVPKDTSKLPLGSHVEENLEVKAKCGRTQCISVYDGRTDRRTSFVFV